MDRAQLADFLRTRREALQPEDVGLGRGPRRRTSGLRREEVASLSGMSSDYYSRLEQQRGPQPSEQMLSAIARGLRLSLDERDHLFRIAGHNAPSRTARTDHISPGIMRVLDRLQDTPAQVISALGETLVQTPPAVALLGDQTSFTGLRRSSIYRWFTDPQSRSVYPDDDHAMHSRIYASDLRTALSRLPGDTRVQSMVEALLVESSEFATLWADHVIGDRHEFKRIQHPELGVINVQCQLLHDHDRSQALLVFTATPGTEDAEKLNLLAVIGAQTLESPSVRSRPPAAASGNGGTGGVGGPASGS
ncbi:helix-turn-helix transcriptional regulator [Amnibacterium flavum]|uniref:Transcriptional regulator n=1 Tax=Amnibacterium flavum TaxID=2173173 RepID=A0A2V1HQS6_9MICO|nr:helix-turn-helix transcriptional regulator [Amnibacterium flavum]PVZ94953.1 transcriptional regulator [Amnibacterium flavum]